MARPDHRDEWLRIEAQLWGCYHHHCFLTEFRSLGKNFLTISLDKTLGAGSLGVQCLRDADGISWALRASDGLAGAGASTSVWSSLMGEGKRETPLPGHLCLSRAAVSPFMWQPLTSTRAPGGGGGSGPFHIRKRLHQGYILSPCLFNFYAEYISKILGWMKHKLESRLLAEISITSDMQMTPPLWQKVKN